MCARRQGGEGGGGFYTFKPKTGFNIENLFFYGEIKSEFYEFKFDNSLET